jgi:transposase-like protein
MPRRVREPVQVYLDPSDRDLLEELARRTGLARAELLRRGLRQLGERLLGDRAPGWSLDALTGALGEAPDLPTDLAARHDEYLYGAAPKAKKRSR